MGSSEQTGNDTTIDLASFTRGLAHELANPLNALAMNAEVARMLIERNEGQRARERLAALIADCGRCGRLLNGIRRFGAGMGLRLDRRDTTIAALVSAARDQLRQEGPVVPVELHGGDTAVSGDPAALARTFEELLRNCLEAGAHNVRIEAARHDGVVRVDVIDDGGGVAPALLEKVLEPFFSTRRNEGSAGLGLTLAVALLRANNGSLAVAAGAAGGTRVRLELADAAVPAPSAVSPAETVPAS